MRRMTRAEACTALDMSASRFAELCRYGYFLSAKQDQPRRGWSVAECCVLAEKNRERPCGVCTAGETLNADERLAHIRIETVSGAGGLTPMLSADASERLLQVIGEICGDELRRAVGAQDGAVCLELRLNSLTSRELKALGVTSEEQAECAA